MEIDRFSTEMMGWSILMPFRPYFVIKNYPNEWRTQYAQAVRKWKSWKPGNFCTVKEYQEYHKLDGN